jgi:HEAT repeat protein
MPRALGLKRREAVFLLEECGPPATAILLELLKDDEPEIRRHAAWALGDIEPKMLEVQPALEALFDDPDEKTRILALQAAAKLHNPGITSIEVHPDRWKQILREARESQP